MMVNHDCNICDQVISWPYAHCSKCDGKGKRCIVKVYPKYTRDCCDQLIKGDFYHCAAYNGGDWDVCQESLGRGLTRKADRDHNLAKLHVPVPWLKNSGGDADSTSRSD